MTDAGKWRPGSFRHGAAVIALLFGSAWLLPLYFDGFRSMLLHALNATLTDKNRDFFSVAATSIMIPISYAWRRSRLAGAVVQIGVLLVIVAWLARYDPGVITTWWSYADVLFVACAGIALLVIALLWLLAYVKRRTSSGIGTRE